MCCASDKLHCASAKLVDALSMYDRCSRVMCGLREAHIKSMSTRYTSSAFRVSDKNFGRIQKGVHVNCEHQQCIILASRSSYAVFSVF